MGRAGDALLRALADLADGAEPECGPGAGPGGPGAAGVAAADAAFHAGRVSWSQVRAVTRVATAENEADLLHVARHSTAAQLERVVRGLRRVARFAEDAADPREAAYRMRARTWYDADGDLVLSVRMAAEHGAVLLAALEQARAELDRLRRVDAGMPGPGEAGTSPAFPRKRPGSARPASGPVIRMPGTGRVIIRAARTFPRKRPAGSAVGPPRGPRKRRREPPAAAAPGTAMQAALRAPGGPPAEHRDAGRRRPYDLSARRGAPDGDLATWDLPRLDLAAGDLAARRSCRRILAGGARPTCPAP